MSMLIIFCNGIAIGISTDYAMTHPLSPVSQTLSDVELSFILFYVVEMIIRICHKGQLFFTEKGERAWNWFDVFCIIVALVGF